MAQSSSVKWMKKHFYGALESPNRRYMRCVEELVGNGSVHILDVGCGYSAPALRSLATGSGVRCGVDLVNDFKPQEAPGVAFVRADSIALPFPDNTFNLVISKSVLEHLDAPQLTFAEISRVLRPGGLFVFLTPNRWDYVSVAASLIPNSLHGRIVRMLTGRLEEDTFPTRYRANSGTVLKKLAERTGMRVVRLERLRESPHYLQSAALLYLMGTAYDWCLARPISFLRPWILGVLECRK
jgi:SAM-dependent methyltransferase